jgi:hypothetical protein
MENTWVANVWIEILNTGISGKQSRRIQKKFTAM